MLGRRLEARRPLSRPHSHIMLLRSGGRCAWAARAPAFAAAATMRRALPLSTQTKKTIQSDSGFNELRERSLLRHVITTAEEGDAEAVTAAMDAFWDTYFNGEGTSEWQFRGAALDSAIRTKQPTVAMEIGAYCGYTAVRMGRLMAPGSKLISIEIDPLFAAIATKVVEHAGLADRVSVEIGSVKDRLPAIHKKFNLSGPLDALLLDHDVGSYLPDLQLLEEHGHLSKGTVVLCDWCEKRRRRSRPHRRRAMREGGRARGLATDAPAFLHRTP